MTEVTGTPEPEETPDVVEPTDTPSEPPATPAEGEDDQPDQDAPSAG